MPTGNELSLHKERAIISEISLVLSLVPTVIGQEQVLYASSPIRRGKRQYKALKRYDVSSIEELNTKQPQAARKLMQKNIRDGRQFGNELRAQRQGLVVIPGDFLAPGWEPKHYMSLWKQFIKKHAAEVHFDKDWSYASGCAEEFLVGLEKDIPLVEREEKRTMNRQDGLVRIWQTIDAIENLGAEPTKLLEAARKIELFKPTTVIDLKPSS